MFESLSSLLSLLVNAIKWKHCGTALWAFQVTDHLFYFLFSIKISSSFSFKMSSMFIFPVFNFELSKLSTICFIFPLLELTRLNLFPSGKNILEKKTSDKSFWRHSVASIRGIFKSKFLDSHPKLSPEESLQNENSTSDDFSFIVIVFAPKCYFFSFFLLFCVSKSLLLQWEEQRRAQ